MDNNEINTIGDLPLVKDMLKNIDIPKVKLDYSSFMSTIDNQTDEWNKTMERLQEGARKKQQDLEDFYNTTKVIAESTVASAEHTKQIWETNEQLLSYNRILIQQLNGINSSLSNLTDEFIDRSRIAQLIELDNGEKLQEMITVLKNPTDESMFDKFKDLPPQVIIGLVLQSMIQLTGLG